MVNSCAVCGCCTRTDIVREHLEDTLRICDVSAKGLFASIAQHFAIGNSWGTNIIRWGGGGGQSNVYVWMYDLRQ